MNEKVMRKHYEATPKETLINILISSREQVDKLQNRNKERKQEIERLNNIINELEKWANNIMFTEGTYCINCMQVLNKIKELKGNEKE